MTRSAPRGSPRDRDAARSAQLVVFDPNHKNPYGFELARCLADSYFVTFYGCAGPLDRARTFAVRSLPGRRPQARTAAFCWMVRRLIAPLRVAARVLRNRDAVVIVVWVTDRWQALILAGTALLRPVHWINHNPPGTRAGYWDVDIGALLDRVSASRPVHSAALLPADEARGRRHPVITHPSFNGLVDGRRWRREGTDNDLRLGFIGAIRPDKGSDMLPGLIHELDDRFTVVFVGAEELSDAVVRAAVRGESAAGSCNRGPRLELVGPYPSDQEVIASLLEVDLVIAPYTEATQSSSLILALTLGVPAVAFRSGALGELLEDDHLAAPGNIQQLLEKIFRLSKAPAWKPTAIELDEACRRSWTRILDRSQ